jgi:UDP-GlcNAc3NAcA epimerase
VKAAAVSGPLRQRHREVLLHTGQHYDDAMSARFFRELQLPAPDIELGVGSGSHAEQTSRMLVGIEAAILSTRPEMVLVYGDTNSTLAGALAAAKMQVPVAHVEAGLRSFNRRMPEEVNRVVTDQLSSWLFCPNAGAAAHLAREGITQGVYVVGDVMADVLRIYGRLPADPSILQRRGLEAGRYMLATVHRAENTDACERLTAIMKGLEALDEPILLPAHPRLREALARNGIVPAGNVHVIDPVGYVDMIHLERHARVILTDSGGVQKEAYWLGIPCVTLRDETEWTETVDAGWNVLAGADADRIVAAVSRMKTPPSRSRSFEDGSAAAAIVESLSQVA